MNVVLWVLQVVLGVYFVAVGVIHFTLPQGLPPMMAWMYELPAPAHYLSGSAEILGGLGLILPGLFRVRPQLTPLAAIGLASVMVLATIWHITRGEPANVISNLVLAGLVALIAYGRRGALRRRPSAARAGG